MKAKLYQYITTTSMDAFLVVDMTGRILEVNEAATAMLGYSKEELLAMTIHDLEAQESRAEVEKHISAVLAQGFGRFESRHYRKDGSIINVEVSSSFVPEAQVFLTFCRDITEAKKNREALDYVNECFTQALNGRQHVLYRLNVRKGCYDYISPAFELITGHRVAEFKENSLETLKDFFHPDDRLLVFSAIDDAIASRTGTTFSLELEYRLRRSDGTYCWLHDSTTACFDDNGQLECFFGSAHDITKLKGAEEERRKMEITLLHAQKLESLGVLAGGIAHDFNNILTAILGNAEMAIRRLDTESPVLDHVKRIEKAAVHAAELAGQMLAYSGQGKFVVETVNLGRVVEDVAQMIGASVSKKAVLRYNLARSVPPVEADAAQIRQVIMNMVINASEAIGDREGFIDIRTGRMECTESYLRECWFAEPIPAGLYAFLEVADTGCGMDQETLAKIFEPFFSTKFVGRGLGMAAVCGIVRGHRGAIKVHSEPDKGTTFTVLLPASVKAASLIEDEADRAKCKGGGKVLLIDDEEAVLSIGAEMLKELGCEPVSASGGVEGITALRSDPDIGVVILDLTMPHMNGEQCFRELRQVKPDVRIIISSGYSEQEVARKFQDKQMDGFIQKPYRMSSLCEALQRLKDCGSLR